MTKEQYLEKRSERLGMYDKMSDTLALNGEFPPYWTAQFGRLLSTLMEPSLEPYYRALAPKFFDRFLSSDRRTRL